MARGRHSSAFTLIELLVVVAIIALLIAILLPSLAAARAQSRRAVCMSNVRSLATAWHHYLNDSGGYFLQVPNCNYNYGGPQGTNQLPWPGLPPPPAPPPPFPKPLNRYVGIELIEDATAQGAHVYRCPSDEGGDEATPTHYAYYGTSYLTNEMLIGQDRLFVAPNDPVRLVLRKINFRLPRLFISRVDTNPAELVLLGDAGWVHEHWRSMQQVQLERIEWHATRRTHVLAFLDGHAAFTRVRKGLFVTQDYVTIPFRDLAGEAAMVQVEEPGD